jgi:hypothetical protein
MKLSTFSFEPVDGWSVSAFPAMDSEQTLVMVFASPEYLEQPSALEELADAYPTSQIIGCSTAGEIAGALVNDTSLSVAVMQFERSSIESAAAEVKQPGDSFAVGKQLGAQLNRSRLTAVFVLADGLSVNGSALLDGLYATLPKNVMITGGLAGDGDRFERTWVIHNRKPASDAVTAVGFYGKHLRIAHGARNGWDGFGPERRITRSDGNVLYELDGKPALALYKEYLGARASALPATGGLFPLSIRRDGGSNSQQVRTMLAIDEAKQSITFGGDMPSGGIARLMRTNFDRLVKGAAEAAGQAANNLAPHGPTLAVAVSSAGRRLVLGERTEEETETTLAQLPSGSSQVGFYSYGEFSAHTSGACELHNQAVTMTTFSEM